MITKTYTSLNGYFKIEISCEAVGQEAPHIYQRSHNYIKVTDLNYSQGVGTVRFGAYTFAFDNNRNIIIDTTEFYRSMSTGDHATFWHYKKGTLTDSISFSVVVNAGANPHELAPLMPKDDYLCIGEDWIRLGYHLPNVIISADAFETETLWHCDIDGGIGNMDGVNAGLFAIPVGTDIVGGSDYPKLIPLKRVSAGTTALVEWDALVGYNAEATFPYGAIRKRAVWEVVSQKTTTYAEEYMTHSNGYYAHKTPSISLTLKLSGLDAYSMHYYSDIISANDVRLILHAGEDITSDEARIEVQTKEIKEQMVGANEYFDLVVEVAYKGLI